MVKPRNPTEKALAQIWCELIGLDEVGVTDDFFDLGGHSVLVTQVAARIRKAFDVDIGLQPIFEKPTIAELARTVEGLLVEQIGSLTEEEAHELTAGTEVFARISE
jgi:acyl carrier protein